MTTQRELTCLITGATSGIGYETARGLAKAGMTTVLVGRDPARAEAAVTRIRADTGNSRIEYFIADLSSQREIRALVARIRASYPRLHVLVNNAGHFTMRRTLSVDEIESQWAVNHLAYFMIAESLADVMRASAPARIINVSSASHYQGDIDFDDLSGARGYSGLRAYGQSKLANVLHAYDLARRLAGTGVTANCLHPGVISTAIGTNNAGIIGLAIRMRRLFLPGASVGARTSIYLATSPEVENTSGEYFTSCAPRKSSAKSYDRALQQRLREVSEAMTGVPAAQGGVPAQA